MKKSNNLWLIILLSFLSCDTGNDVETDSGHISTMLVGTWELAEITSEGGRIGSATPTSPNYFEILFYGEGEDLDVQLTFSENPNSLELSGDGFLYVRHITETSGNVTVSPDVETDSENIGEQWPFSYDFMAPGNGWKVEEGKYLYDHVQGSLRVDFFAEILELDETTMRLKMRYNEDFPKTGPYWGRETSFFYATFLKI